MDRTGLIVLDSLRHAYDELQLLEVSKLMQSCVLEKREEAAASFQKHILALQNNKNEDDPLVAAAEGEGFVGTGTEPNTFAPIEFVVFNTDELVLQFQFQFQF
ncbi:hypothetical protein Ahy_A07g031398 [Arachis hypogaea]|uniref:Uncharacterized protein n=1 Tax=Arachis hypogaea TaxID=3818 RepID=A0A445C3T0_ARAHY|nr:hypothetical protein Ahy_A07g031398 [Arachis hypogaea]